MEMSISSPRLVAKKTQQPLKKNRSNEYISKQASKSKENLKFLRNGEMLVKGHKPQVIRLTGSGVLMYSMVIITNNAEGYT